MKKITFIISIIALLSLFSCQDKNATDIPAGKGLLNFTVMIPDQPGEYSAKEKGPYEDGQTIIIEVPTTYETPVDLTALEAYASFDNNCYADPPVPSIIDFTEPYEIHVYDGQGNMKTHYIEIETVYPKVQVQEMWRKDNNSLGLQYTNWMDLAANENYVYILDAVQNVGDKIKVYDRKTGDHVSDITVPTSMIAQIHTDASGRLVATRYNLYGAGFRLYVYDEDIQTWEGPIIDYVPIEGEVSVTEQLGLRASLYGDLKNGTAYVYATAPNDMSVYCWTIENGTVKSNVPQVTVYSNARSVWSYATVQRKSSDPNSDHYIAYTHYTGADDTNASFEQFSSTMDITSIDPANYGPRILEFVAFNTNGDEWLAMAYQDTYERWSNTHLALYDITDRSLWNMTPEDSGYNFQFRLFNSKEYGGVNYEQTAGMATVVEQDATWIYVTSAAKGGDNDATAACLMCYKMTYTAQE